MDTTQEVIAWLTTAVEKDFLATPSVRILAHAKQALAADRPAGLSMADAEHALMVAQVEVRAATAAQVEQLGDLLATFIRKLYDQYAQQGFSYPEVGLVEASRRILISAY